MNRQAKPDTGRTWSIAGTVVTEPRPVTVDGEPAMQFVVVQQPQRLNPATKELQDFGPPEYYQVTADGPQGKRAGKLHCGDRVMAFGMLTLSEYQTPNGGKAERFNLAATEIGYSIRYNEVHIQPNAPERGSLS